VKYHKRRLLNEVVIFYKRFFTRRNVVLVVLISFLLSFVVPIIFISSLRSSFETRTTLDIDDIKPAKAAIVFTNPLSSDDQEQLILNRIKLAEELFNDGRIDKVILAGELAEQFASKIQVDKDSLVVDSISTRTFDSCFVAKNKYNISKGVVISQKIHLVRALYICNSLGLNAQGLVAAEVGEQGLEQDWLTETLAFGKAVWDAVFLTPQIDIGDTVEL